MVETNLEKKRKTRGEVEGGAYMGIALIVGVIAFFASWLYCIATYGFFIGVLLGWVPSIIAGAVIGILWPVVVIAAFLIFKH